MKKLAMEDKDCFVRKKCSKAKAGSSGNDRNGNPLPIFHRKRLK
jgi:hypothetical protein